ncbi:hypothetical protein CsatB_010116 [Cannabis sativa]
MVNVMNRLGYDHCVCIPSIGIVGGFCVAWKRGIQCYMLEEFAEGLHLSIHMGENFPDWSLYCVYGTPYYSLKGSYWKWLSETVSNCNSPWVLLGDLNVILDDSEKEEGRTFQRKEGEFLSNFLFEVGGVDLGCDGGMCTWQNSRIAESRVRKRLNRAIADARWCTEFSNARVSKFPIKGSDHAPILLNIWGDQTRLRYLFRFLEVWTSRPDCEVIIQNSWRRVVTGEVAAQLQKKLKGTAHDLKKWNREVFGFCDKRLKELAAHLQAIQSAQISQYNVEREAEIQLDIIDMEAKMDRIWKQKSRENWLLNGDDNTKFFHKSTIIRRRRNFIGSIEDDQRVWLRQREEIGGYFQTKFKALYESSENDIGEDFESLFQDKVM